MWHWYNCVEIGRAHVWTQSHHLLQPSGLIFVSSPSMYRELSYGSVYRSCCCMNILISSLCPNVVLTNGLYVWVSILTIRSSKIGSSSMLRMSVIVQLFRTANPKDCKNATFAEFLFLGWLDISERRRCCRWPRKVLFLTSFDPFNTSISYIAYVRYRRSRRTCNLTVILLENRAIVLVDNA